VITSDTGTLVGTQAFEPFGSGGTTGSGALQFTGHERDRANLADGTVELPDYAHARLLDTGGGRFLAVDPIMSVEAMRSPQLWNRYTYVGNNAMNRIDPTGKILQFAGSDANLEKVKQIANSGLHGFKLSINGKGVASLEKVKVKGKETKEQKSISPRAPKSDRRQGDDHH